MENLEKQFTNETGKITYHKDGYRRNEYVYWLVNRLTGDETDVSHFEWEYKDQKRSVAWDEDKVSYNHLFVKWLETRVTDKEANDRLETQIKDLEYRYYSDGFPNNYVYWLIDQLKGSSTLDIRGDIAKEYFNSENVDTIYENEAYVPDYVDWIEKKLIEKEEQLQPQQSDPLTPKHYGGADNLYEAIKVIEAWYLGFNLGNVVKYVSRAGKKGDTKEDLSKALWYLKREIDKLEKA